MNPVNKEVASVFLLIAPPNEHDLDVDIIGAFSTYGNATKYRRNQIDPKARPRPDICEFKLDKDLDLPKIKWATEYHVCLACRDPRPATPHHVNIERIQVTADTQPKRLLIVEVKYGDGPGAYANGYSIISAEDAFKVAKRGRIAWLKKNPTVTRNKTAKYQG